MAKLLKGTIQYTKLTHDLNLIKHIWKLFKASFRQTVLGIKFFVYKYSKSVAKKKKKPLESLKPMCFNHIHASYVDIMQGLGKILLLNVEANAKLYVYPFMQSQYIKQYFK